MEFQFRKECSLIWKRNTHGGVELRTTMCASRERPRRISRQKFPKRMHILYIPSKLTVFLPFCSFCYREQNERNDIPFIGGAGMAQW